MSIFCPLVAPLAEKINFSPKQKFSEFQRICHIYLSNWALWNSKLEEQLSLRPFLISFNFDQLYLVNLCPIFVDSLQNLSDICKTGHSMLREI